MNNIEMPPTDDENKEGGENDGPVIEPEKGNVRTPQEVEEERQRNLDTDDWREQK